MSRTRCSFCGKGQDHVRRLVRGPGVQVCDECIGLIDAILDTERSTQTARREPAASARLANCSFCGKSQNEVWKLVAGPGVYICDECFRLSRGALEEDEESPALGSMADDVDALLGQLRQAKATFDQLSRMLAPSVERLRAKDVSWARIGEALGMSRQSAWERFSGEE